MSAREVFSGLIERGMAPHIAAGFAGNYKQESGFNPAALNRDEGAFGLAQWRLDRRQNLHTMFGATPSLDNQLDFTMWELGNTEADAWNKIQNATTPQEAAELIDQHFERSAGTERDARVAFANEIYGAYGSGEGRMAPPTAASEVREASKGNFNAFSKAALDLHSASEQRMAKALPSMFPPQAQPTGPGPVASRSAPPAGPARQAAAPARVTAQPDATVSSSGPGSQPPEDAEGDSIPFADRLAGIIFPNRPTSEGREAVGDVLKVLSTGFGQMGAGERVNLAPFFANQQEYRRRVAQDRANQARQVRSDQIEEARLSNDLMRTELQRRRLQHDMQGVETISPAMLERLGADPRFEGQGALLDMATQGGDLGKLARGKIVEQLADGFGAAGMTPEQQSYARVLGNPRANPTERANAVSEFYGTNPSPDQVKALQDYEQLANPDAPSAVTVGDALWQADQANVANGLPPRYANPQEAMLEAASAMGGAGLQDKVDEQITLSNIQRAQEREDALQTSWVSSADMQRSLLLADNALDVMISMGARPPETEWETWLADSLGAIGTARLTEGQATELADNMGLDYKDLGMTALDAVDQYRTALSQFQQAYSSVGNTLTRQANEGMGTLSDSDRAALERAFKTPNTTLSAIKGTLAGLQSKNSFDTLKAHAYIETAHVDGYSNADALYRELTSVANRLAPEVAASASALASNGIEVYSSRQHMRYLLESAPLPLVTESEFGTYKEAFPIITIDQGDGAQQVYIYRERKPDGTIGVVLDPVE